MLKTSFTDEHKQQRIKLLTLRTLAAILGGYAFCWGWVSLGIALLHALGLPFHDAEQLALMSALLAYVAVFVWAFAAQRMAWVWGVLIAGTALMLAAALFIQQRVLT